MLNQLVLVGRLSNKTQIKLNEKGEPYMKIKLQIMDTQEQPIYVGIDIHGQMTNSVNEYCQKGDILGVKGSIGVKNNLITIIANKVTFLSAKKDIELEEE